MEAEPFAFEQVLDEPSQDTSGELLLRRLRREVVGLQVSEVSAPKSEVVVDFGDRDVVEVSVVPAITELLGNADRSQQLRILQHKSGEGLLVEKVEAEGPEPDEVDQEHRGGEQRGRE